MAMLPRLDAEEKLAAASIAALGSGAMARSDAKTMARRLERAARGGRAGRASAERADARILAAMGIGVSEVEEGASDG